MNFGHSYIHNNGSKNGGSSSPSVAHPTTHSALSFPSVSISSVYNVLHTYNSVSGTISLFGTGKHSPVHTSVHIFFSTPITDSCHFANPSFIPNNILSSCSCRHPCRSHICPSFYLYDSPGGEKRRKRRTCRSGTLTNKSNEIQQNSVYEYPTAMVKERKTFNCFGKNGMEIGLFEYTREPKNVSWQKGTNKLTFKSRNVRKNFKPYDTSKGDNSKYPKPNDDLLINLSENVNDRLLTLLDDMNTACEVRSHLTSQYAKNCLVAKHVRANGICVSGVITEIDAKKISLQSKYL